jgi:hypothetical protein
MTDPTPIIPPAEANRRAALAFWRHLLPVDEKLWTDDDFENHLNKVEEALAAHPDIDIGRKGRLAKIVTNHLKKIVPGSEERQFAILGQLAARGWQFEAQDIVGLADQLQPSSFKEAERTQHILKRFINDLSQAGQVLDVKRIVMVFEAPSSPFSPLLMISLQLAGLDVMGAGGAAADLVGGNQKPADWAVAVASSAPNPLDHGLTRYFNSRADDLTVVWQARVMADPRLAAALAEFDNLKKEKPLFTLADLTRPVTTGAEPLFLIDMLALSGRAGDVLVADRWQGNARELSEVIALFEQRLDKLPVDKAALLTAVQRHDMQRAARPRVKFMP